MQIEKNCNLQKFTSKRFSRAAGGFCCFCSLIRQFDWIGNRWRTKRLIADSHQGRPQSRKTQCPERRRHADMDDNGPGRSHRAKSATTDCNCLAMTKRTPQPGQDCQTAGLKKGDGGQLQNQQTIIKLHSPQMQMQMELAA